MQSAVTEAIFINDKETRFTVKKGFFVIKIKMSDWLHPKHPRLEIAIAALEIKPKEPGIKISLVTL